MKNVRIFGAPLLATGLMLGARTAAAQVVSTLAGSGAIGSADGNAATASFSYPQGLAVDSSGNIYVADGSLKIRKIATNGFVTTIAGNGLPGYDDGPAESSRFWGPLGLAVDAAGAVWVADSGDVFDGAYVKKIINGFVENLVLYPGYAPTALAFDRFGALYILDEYEGFWRVSADSSATRLASLWMAQISLGVAVDGAGNAYVSDPDFNRILKISPSGAVTTLAGTGDSGNADGTGTTTASFRHPAGLAVDEQGNVYVADRDNHTIRKITAEGRVTTLAGTGKTGSSNGLGTAASFNSPTGLALDSEGDLYVADSLNQRIRKITFSASPISILMDTPALAASNGNGVLEPGETVRVAPRWKNPSITGMSLAGTASALTCPQELSCSLVDSSASYSIAAGATTDCFESTSNCYEVSASPAEHFGIHWDASLTEVLSTDVSKTWTLHIGGSFADVPAANPYYADIEKLYHNGITVGCNSPAAGYYCPDGSLTRLQLAIFLARAQAGSDANIPLVDTARGIHYDCYPGGISVFTDVPPGDPFCRHANYIYKTGLTTGYSGVYPDMQFNPSAPATRLQMAIFVARALAGGDAAVAVSYGPDPVTGRSYNCESSLTYFTDYPQGNPNCRHVHYVWAKGVIEGGTFFDGSSKIRRDEMARFLVNGFDLKF
ncbi:MAG TPA: S-layer homology domain-containing protein [Thermoanaerobaculia bacterium]|nr:S-layer homology domain-containing protein [Thermoanaerobaculia bacterium]